MAASTFEFGSPSRRARDALVHYWPYCGQTILAATAVYLYRIDPILLRVMILAAIGFSVSVILPRSYRLTFFVALSLLSAIVTLGMRDGGCLIGLGLVILGICRLHFRLGYRIILLLVTATIFAIMRNGWNHLPWSPAVWPVLASMFMFRTVLYLRAQAGKAAGFQESIAYFFMLPNLAFPLFPVVDFEGFRQNYFDRDESEIYRRGTLWISRGITHLVLYRFVYQNISSDPVDAVSLGDLTQSILGTYLLYLRISGQFHLAVGLLHLFGFRLPETNNLYYLSHSFTELWRRMNIYWTDFMSKVVFYPTYFRLKRLGQTGAVSCAIAAVFVASWILHSYQWFWLQGEFPIRLQDVLFWGGLGCLGRPGNP